MDIGSIVKRDKETLTKYLLSLELKLKKLYGDTYAKAMQLQSVREAIERGDMGFTWKGNPDAEKKLDKLLDNLANNSFTGIAEGINRSYNQGQTTAEKAVESQYKDSPNKEQINDICKEATEQHRINVTKSYTTATQANGGQKLSSRVWGLNEQSKTELEIAIQNAIIEGKSADEASRDIRKYLNNPDALFRRVRDKETGELVLSEAAKNYHPGRGVYRSAYKNALRMARTEINAAYLQAEIESYQSNPLVTGYEIKLSGNHTTTLPNGKVVHLEDICDRLAGEYPKTFRFTGWHPQCRCYIVPITLKEQTADKQLEDKGEIDSSKEQIDEVPKNMTDWVQDNQDRIDSAKQLPPFIEDNKELIEQPKEITLTGHESLQELSTKLGSEMPKTLENLQNEIEEAENKPPYKYWADEEKDNANKIMREVLDNGDFGMNIPRVDINGNDNVIDKIFKEGFKSQIETGTSNGCLDIGVRKKASERLFGTDINTTPNNGYEKYGFLMSKNILSQARSAIAGSYWNYGDGIQVRFKKDKVLATFTVGDSLGMRFSKPSLCSDPHVTSFMPHAKNSLPDYNNISPNVLKSAIKATNLLQKNGYIELQYHGQLTIDCIESVFVPQQTLNALNQSTIDRILGSGAKVYTEINKKLVKLA